MNVMLPNVVGRDRTDRRRREVAYSQQPLCFAVRKARYVDKEVGAQDHDNLAERRHLLRLWISPTENRPLPEEYTNLWNSTIPGERGGILMEGNLTVPLNPE